MPSESGTYQTITTPVEGVIFKERKSKFIGYAYPVRSEQQIKRHQEVLRQQYPDANHICYAWKLGIKEPLYRTQDDGEPRNSAGVPIYGQINSLDLTNIVVFVVRYFGGVKLGVGGLISAYKTTARNTLELAEIKEESLSCSFSLRFDYSEMNTVERLVSRLQVRISERILEEEALFILNVPLNVRDRFLNAVHRLYKVKLEELDHN